MKPCSIAALTLLALGLTVGCAPAAAEDAVLLRDAWTKGDFVALVRTATRDQSEGLAGKPVKKSTVGSRQVVGVDSRPPWPGMAPFGNGIRSGYSILTVKNGTQTDAVVKLIQLGSPKRHVRNFYIPQGKSYTTREIPPGDYVLRVAFGKDWDRTDRKFTSERSFSQTQTFDITEEKTARGVRYTRLRITLHKVVGGNFKSDPISEADFAKE